MEFQDDVVRRADVQEMIKRIHFYIDPVAESAGLDKMTSIMKITLKNGKVINGHAEFAKGSPSNPMSYEEVGRQIPRLRGIREMACGESRICHCCREIAGNHFGYEQADAVSDQLSAFVAPASRRRVFPVCILYKNRRRDAGATKDAWGRFQNKNWRKAPAKIPPAFLRVWAWVWPTGRRNGFRMHLYSRWSD